jgi:uncharacterized membrane protein
MVSAVPVVLAVSTGVVVIAVAAAVVLVVLIVAVSMRGRQKRAAQQRGEARRHVDEERKQAARVARDRDTAREGGDELRSGG